MLTSKKDNNYFDYEYYLQNEHLNFIIEGKPYQGISLLKNNEISFSEDEEYVFLRVGGDSMNQAKPVPIEDGDYVLVRRQQVAQSGDIVVAVIVNIKDNPATIKRLMHTDGRILLLPESSDPIFSESILYKPVIKSDEIRILGVVLAVLKPRKEEIEYAEIIYPNILRVRIELPRLIDVKDFQDITTQKIQAIEFIYSVYTLLYSQDQKAIKALLKFLKDSHNESFIDSRFLLNEVLNSVKIEPLRIASMKYGSPATFDLLGIGSILEQVRDTIKDISWKGKHERKAAEAELNKLKLETAKIAIEITKEKIGLIERTTQLNLSSADKNMIISALARGIEVIDMSTNIPLLYTGSKKLPRTKIKKTNDNSKKSKS